MRQSLQDSIHDLGFFRIYVSRKVIHEIIF